MNRKKLWDAGETVINERIRDIGQNGTMLYECAICGDSKREIREVEHVGSVCERCLFSAPDCCRTGCDGIAIDGLRCRDCLFDYAEDVREYRERILGSQMSSIDCSEAQTEKCSDVAVYGFADEICAAYNRFKQEVSDNPERFGCRTRKAAS